MHLCPNQVGFLQLLPMQICLSTEIFFLGFKRTVKWDSTERVSRRCKKLQMEKGESTKPFTVPSISAVGFLDQSQIVVIIKAQSLFAFIEK